MLQRYRLVVQGQGAMMDRKVKIAAYSCVLSRKIFSVPWFSYALHAWGHVTCFMYQNPIYCLSLP